METEIFLKHRDWKTKLETLKGQTTNLKTQINDLDTRKIQIEGAQAPGGIPGMQAAAKPMAAKPAMPGQPAAPVPGSSPIGSQSVMGANRMANKLKGMGF